MLVKTKQEFENVTGGLFQKHCYSTSAKIANSLSNTSIPYTTDTHSSYNVVLASSTTTGEKLSSQLCQQRSENEQFLVHPSSSAGFMIIETKQFNFKSVKKNKNNNN